MELIWTNDKWIEQGYLKKDYQIDMEIGFSYASANDFELSISMDKWDRDLKEGSLIFEDDIDSEIGGMICGINPNTVDSKIKLYGYTWRGLLNKKAITPPSGKAYYEARQDANVFIKDVIGNQFDGLIKGTDELSGVNVNYDIRYVQTLEAMEKALANANLRLKFSFDTVNHVCVVSAVPIVVHEDTEWSNDYGIKFEAKAIKDGYNHMICLGKGELLDRTVKHLYLLKNGSFTQDKSKAISNGITGLNDRVYIYDYNSAEDDNTLIQEGQKKFDEIKDTKTLEIKNVENIDVGDIVGAREYLTNIYMQTKVVSKLIKGYIDRATIESKVGE